MAAPRPNAKPSNPSFSSGPCAKRPGWSLEALRDAALGRSHRSAVGKEKLARAIALTREILQPPSDYRVAIVPGSDTGAMEMAMWTLLGRRPVDILACESFSRNWAYDILTELELPQARILDAPFGELPDLTGVNPDNDLVFAWNGTSAGVRVPSADFIAADRRGLTICDATSAAFAQRLDFAKLDATTFSWQKSLGGEAAHGVLILSPRAVERLTHFRPPWPLPKLFRLVKDGRLNEGIFSGQTINTPSLLCVEDYLDALGWAKSIGGLEALLARVDANAAAIAEWVARTPAFDFFVKDPKTRSNTALCLEFADPRVTALKEEARAALARRLVALVEQEGAGFDFGAYRDAPPGLRIWCGATVETADLRLLTQWIDWAYDAAAAQFL